MSPEYLTTGGLFIRAISNELKLSNEGTVLVVAFHINKMILSVIWRSWALMTISSPWMLT